MDIKSFESFRKEVLDVYLSLRDLPEEEILNNENLSLNSHFGKLSHLGTAAFDSPTSQKIRSNPKYPETSKKISRLLEKLGLKRELDSVQELLAASHPWKKLKSLDFFQDYRKQITAEYEAAKLTKQDHVILLGSGPLPMSLISLYAHFGIKGTGIEQVAAYASLSEQLIQHLGLTEEIRILRGDHFALPLTNPCKLLMITFDASPRDEILTHLGKTLPAGTQVSLRISEILTLGNPLPIPPEFTEKCRIHPPPPAINTVLLLQKE